MKRWRLILLILIIALSSSAAWYFFGSGQGAGPVGQPTPAPDGEGWINLLDEAHEKGWENTIDDKDIFAIEEGVLHIFGKTIYPLRYAGYTAQAYSDFDLHLEFKLDSGANSGLFLRAQKGDPVLRGFEVQILEDFGDAPTKNSCGALYDIATPMYNLSRPAGEWNSYDISLHGDELIVFMNGWRVLHVDLAKMTTPLGKFKVPYAELPKEGYIALQDHGGEAWYQNVMIRSAVTN